MTDHYLSLGKEGRSTFRDRASKFIGIALPVRNEEEIRTKLEAIRKEYYDANHHCYAYRLGKSGDQFRMNDDGEPSGSAGRPIYGQLLSGNVSDALVVVIRYFGGTKLGIPGLIHAYRTTAQLALEEAGTREVVVMVEGRVDFPYLQMNAVMKVLKEMHATMVSQEFGESCSIRFSIREAQVREAESRLNKIINIFTSIYI